MFLTDGVCYQKRIVLSWLYDSHFFFTAYPSGSITGSVYPCIYFLSSQKHIWLSSGIFVVVDLIDSHTFSEADDKQRHKKKIQTVLQSNTKQ